MRIVSREPLKIIQRPQTENPLTTRLMRPFQVRGEVYDPASGHSARRTLPQGAEA